MKAHHLDPGEIVVYDGAKKDVVRTPDHRLLEVDPDLGMRIRYLEGRLLHGEHWSGAHPLVEAYTESLDLGVYARVAAAWGDLEGRDAKEIGDALTTLQELIQSAYSKLARGEPERLTALRPRSGVPVVDPVPVAPGRSE